VAGAASRIIFSAKMVDKFFIEVRGGILLVILLMISLLIAFLKSFIPILSYAY